MVKDEKDTGNQEKEEKEWLLEYMKMQNEALKRIFKNTIDKDKQN